MTKVEQILQELVPDDGWWKSETGDIIEKSARRLLAAGFTIASAVVVLGDIIDAMRGEYGD